MVASINGAQRGDQSSAVTTGRRWSADDAEASACQCHGRAALDETGARLALVGRISRQLYDPSGAAQPLVAFLTELCRGVIDASGRTDVELQVTGDQRLRLEPDAAVPTALIVAEAVANAIEHGFADGRAGRITVATLTLPAHLLTIEN